MKRLMILIPFLVLGILGYGKGNENYVVLDENSMLSVESTTSATLKTEYTVGDRLLCKKVRLGAKYSNILLDNGVKIKVNTNDIKSYRLNNNLYFNLPLYENGKNTNRMIFMQLVGVKGGYNLFKYSKLEEGIDKNTGVYLGVSPVNYYMVFRGDQYAYEVSEKNYQDVFKKFGVKILE